MGDGPRLRYARSSILRLLVGLCKDNVLYSIQASLPRGIHVHVLQNPTGSRWRRAGPAWSFSLHQTRNDLRSTPCVVVVPAEPGSGEDGCTSGPVLLHCTVIDGGTGHMPLRTVHAFQPCEYSLTHTGGEQHHYATATWVELHVVLRDEV